MARTVDDYQWPDDMPHDIRESITAGLNRASAEYDAMERDAARYRWLKEQLQLGYIQQGHDEYGWTLSFAFNFAKERPLTIDAAIDAAMKTDNQPQRKDG